MSARAVACLGATVSAALTLAAAAQAQRGARDLISSGNPV